MKILALLIYSKSIDAEVKPILLAESFYLNDFSIFIRSTIKEHILFISRLIISKTDENKRITVRQNEDSKSNGKIPFLIHCHIRPSQGTNLSSYNEFKKYDSRSLCGVVISDLEYPQLKAYSLINKFLTRHFELYPKCLNTLNDQHNSPDHLMDDLKKFQNPQADNAQLEEVQQKVNDIKTIMNKNIQQMLDRGENLDNLVDKSQELSNQSKLFYKQSKKANSCCRY